MRSKNHDAPCGRSCAAVGAPEMHDRDATVCRPFLADRPQRWSRAAHRLSPPCLRARSHHTWRRSDRAGHSLRCRSTAADRHRHAIASLRKNAKRHTERPQHTCDNVIKVAGGNRRHRVLGRARCSPGTPQLVTGYTQFLLRLIIKWRQLLVADRPVDADAKTALHAKIARPVAKH